MKIYFGGGNCRFDIEQPILGFQIGYKGTIKAESQLVDGWNVAHKNRKIIGFSLVGATNLIDLFTYEGEFNIVKCLVVTENNELLAVLSQLEGSTRIIDMNNLIVDTGTEIQFLDKTPTVGKKPSISSFSGKGVVDLGIVKDRKLSKKAKQIITRGRYGL